LTGDNGPLAKFSLHQPTLPGVNGFTAGIFTAHEKSGWRAADPARPVKKIF
jgi:hypothetical protein